MDKFEMPRTLYDKLWDSHIVKPYPEGDHLLYIDRHLVQEVSSPQAFSGLEKRGLSVRRADAQILVADHAVSTEGDQNPEPDSLAAQQLDRLAGNAMSFALPYIPLGDKRHGIVHLIGPELGFTLPGSTLVCGDSHTSTHGAFGALAFGIGSSECETVLATQCLRQKKQKQMRITLNGTLARGVSAKDVILSVIARIGNGGARGYAIEYAGPAVENMSMEARMTLCNMTIEAGSRTGLVAPDKTTIAYLHGRPLAPAGAMWDHAVSYWSSLKTEDGASFDREMTIDVSDIGPQISWGTTPAHSLDISGEVPGHIDELSSRALKYMGLETGAALDEIPIDKVFIGSCTNGRIEDLRRSASVARGRKVAERVSAIVVPGSASVRAQAEAEGLDKIFIDAGFEWRKAGCSMCVAMNQDRLKPGERCASTSNRNFEGRQGAGGKTHLMSPEMATAAAIAGQITDVRKMLEEDDAEI